MIEYLYLIMDGRYRNDPDTASVISVEDSLHEARKEAKEHGDVVIVRHRVQGRDLIDEGEVE